MQTQLAALRVVRLLGEGASSQVYEVVEPTAPAETTGSSNTRESATTRRYSLKVARDQQGANALMHEAETLLLARGRTLPQLKGVGSLPKTLIEQGVVAKPGANCLLFDWIGQNQALSRLSASGAEALALAHAVLRDVSEALSDLHELGLAHGDVKPDNILVQKQPGGYACWLIDLGLASSATSHTLDGGTLRYLPPEALSESQTSNSAARDLWALGISVLELLVPQAKRAPHPEQSLSCCPQSLLPLVRALLEPRAAQRPSARWLLGTLSEPSLAQPERDRARLRRAYLRERRTELLSLRTGAKLRLDVDGLPAQWLTEHAELLQQLGKLRPATSASSTIVLASLSEERKRKLLTTLIGPETVDFPPLPAQTDKEFIEGLCELVQSVPLEGITFAAITGNLPELTSPKLSALDIAVLLGREAPSGLVLDQAEALIRADQASGEVFLATVRALKRKNQLARALALCRLFDTPPHKLEQAKVLLRAGHTEAADEQAQALLDPSLEPSIRSGALALLARIALMQNAPERAHKLLKNAPPSTAYYESKASLELTEGHLSAAKESLSKALTLPHDAEQRSRIEALRANLEQQSGNAAAALEGFSRAAEYAARASAVVEEATYLTGVASTAVSLGKLRTALRASLRSSQLFEVLNQPTAAARASLAQAGALLAAGARTEALAAAQTAQRLARAASDARCEGFAHLICADAAEAPLAIEHANRAATLLGQERKDDELRSAARLCRLQALSQAQPTQYDALASTDLPADSRLEWWAARAERALAESNASDKKQILKALLPLAGANLPPDLIGPAAAFATQLAAQLNDGESANRLSQAASAALNTLLSDVPDEHRLALTQSRWAQLIRSPRESDIAPEQLSDIETLIHGLSERTQLKPLLDRALDALVLWTGVERGLLLLNAPQGRLVPRAARNLARQDLTEDQLALSRSLAERAMSTGECVVAVDATGELPELHKSVHALKLRSVLAVPLYAKGHALGVVYLDDRMRRGAFGDRELAWVKLVATLAAVAISDTRDQLQLRRSAQKAKRAEQKLAELLDQQQLQLEQAERQLQDNTRGTRYRYDTIVGKSAATEQLLQLLDRVAPSEVPVLIFGESGSGKELVAKELHRNGPRAEAPFIGENCSAIPEGLLESTLFGHTKGAFTGASKNRAGLFEIADGGTLFLDEIADMSLNMQAKLLRVLEDGEVRRLGAERSTKVDVRIIGATHKNLEQLVTEGTFREDLLYRLNVISIRVPALRERIEDIPLLMDHFMRKHGTANGRPHLSQDALNCLKRYSWPGNVRQLENETRRVLVLAGDEITAEDLSPRLRGENPSGSASGLNLRDRLDGLERQLVQQALGQTGGNQTKAAKLLGVSRFGLQKMIRRLDIDIHKGRAGQSRRVTLTE